MRRLRIFARRRSISSFATVARLTADLPYQIKDAIEALKPFGVRVDLGGPCLTYAFLAAIGGNPGLFHRCERASVAQPIVGVVLISVQPSRRSSPAGLCTGNAPPRLDARARTGFAAIVAPWAERGPAGKRGNSGAGGSWSGRVAVATPI